MSAKAGDCSVLLLLDLSAAFDHNILINRLTQCVGISGTAIRWFKSYLSDREISVSIGNNISLAQLICGVQQGSILGHMLFSL